MNTTNIDILRSFYSVTNRSKLTREIFNLLLKRWELDKINLGEENIKIDNKMSNLSKSKREAVKEFIILESILKVAEEQTKADETLTESINNDENTTNQQLIVGNIL